jgi:acyl-coenzyme A thioesterase PaaI-like protein
VTETLPADLPRLTPDTQEGGRDAAAAAARRLVDAVLRAGDAEDLTQVTRRIDALADELLAEAPSVEERLVEMWAPPRPRHDAATGAENPVAPPLTVYGDADGWVEGRVTLPLAYQGQPGIAHGGISALMVDHTLGVANNWAKNSGSTARLVLNYRKPVPLFTPLTLRAKQVGAEGRKIFTEGTLYANGEVCVEAEALFVQGHFPRPAR